MSETNDSIILIENYSTWTRSKEGVLAGIFESLAKSLDKSANLLRILYLVTIFAFGIGFILYPLCWFILPKEGTLNEYHRSKIFGGCIKISEKFKIDLGLVRLVSVLSFITTMGTTALLYIIISFILSRK